MKKSRKLIPALVMLLVSAVMMSTASYAWFSMNQSVEATGMSVTAMTPASLEIKAAESSDWAYRAELTKNVTNLKPVYLDETTGKWFIPTAANTVDKNGDTKVDFDAADSANWAEVAVDVADTGMADSVQYALVQKFNFRTNAGAATTGDEITFGAEATVGGTSKLKDGVKVYVLYQGTYTDITGEWRGNWTAPIANANPNNIELTVVIFYNGENAVVNNDMADLIASTVSIVFAHEDPTPATP